MTPIDGLEAYAPAPEPIEPPAWIGDMDAGIVSCDDGVGLLLTSATDDTAVWREVVRLAPLPYGWEVDAQRCTAESLRAHRKHEKQVARLEKQQAESGSTSPTEWSGAVDVFGNRICLRFDGLAVHLGPPPPQFGFDLHHFSVPSRPGEVDCRQKCPADPWEDIEAAVDRLAGKWFYPPDGTSFEVVRTSETTDLCTLLGSTSP